MPEVLITLNFVYLLGATRILQWFYSIPFSFGPSRSKGVRHQANALRKLISG